MKNQWLVLLFSVLLIAACGDENSPSKSECGSAKDDRGCASSDPDEEASENPAEEPERQKAETLPDLPGDELQMNKAYRNGETLKMSVYGVSFKLPRNAACGIENDATALELASTEKQSLGFVYLKREVNENEVIAELKQPQTVEQGVLLQCQGEPEKKDGVWYFTHADATYEGHSAVIIGPEGNGVLFFLGGLKSDSEHFRGVIEALAKSAVVGTPLESQTLNQWKQMLSGHKLTYLDSYSSSDGLGGGVFSETNREFTLYADGTYTYKDNSNYSVGTSGGAGVADGRNDAEQGTWKVELAGTQTLLIFESQSGTREYKLAFKDKKTYLSGTRWFRTPIE